MGYTLIVCNDAAVFSFQAARMDKAHYGGRSRVLTREDACMSQHAECIRQHSWILVLAYEHVNLQLVHLTHVLWQIAA